MDKRNKCNQRRLIWCFIIINKLLLYQHLQCEIPHFVEWISCVCSVEPETGPALEHRRQKALGWINNRLQYWPCVLFYQQRELFHHASFCSKPAVIQWRHLFLKLQEGWTFTSCIPEPYNGIGVKNIWMDLLHHAFAFEESLFDFKQWKLAYHPTSKNTPLIFPHSHLSWASFEHLNLWILCCDLQSVKVQFSRINISVWRFLSTLLTLDMESYNPSETVDQQPLTMTFGLRPDFTDLTVDNWGTLQTVLLCSSVNSIVVLHNSTAVLME